MKKILSFTLILTLAIIPNSSCKKIQNLVGYLECQIDGGGKVKAYQVLGTATDDFLFVNGTGIFGKSVTLTITNFTGIGTYTVSPPNVMINFGNPTDPLDLWGVDSTSTGTITITDKSGKYVDGTFEGNLVFNGDSKTITNGKFRFVNPL